MNREDGPGGPQPDEDEDSAARREAERRMLGEGGRQEEAGNAARRRTILLTLVGTFALVAVLHRLLMAGGVGQSAAMFIGVPALMAVGLSFVPRARTITGAILWNMTFTLLLLGILLIEGFVCLLMAAPLFYVIGLIIGICADRQRVQRDMARFRCVVLVVFGFMALEGVVPVLSFPRENVVVIARDVPGTLAGVRERLRGTPELSPDRLPGFFRLGFPVPEGIEQTGPDAWSIAFDHGEESPRLLRVRCSEPDPRTLRYRIVEDGTKIAEWLTWHDGTWTLQELDGGMVRATLTVRYRRELDPAWYFGPLERHGVRTAAGYFADELLAHPADGR